MQRSITHIFAISFSLCILSSLSAQESKLPKILLDVPPDTLFIPGDSLKLPFQLPDQFIIPSSERLHIKSFNLIKNIHYQLDYREGKLQLLRDFPDADSVRIIYRKYPFPLILDYYHRELKEIVPEDTTLQTESEIIATESRAKFLDDVESYSSDLQKSGSIVRGIELGNTQDLTLNSGLNLQLSGKISPDVELVAALTDESTPIQPEGNTQTLREVDKVFVKIKSPHIGGALGDIQTIYGQTLFGNLQRKLQGVSVENTYKTSLQSATFGTSRGFFHTNMFLAQEGNQGPYLLTGRNGEREIITLAGTEKVYVDGILQVRGENFDYIIDYGLSQITFTSKRLITSENRIEVDFEYTNTFQRYGRNFLGLTSGATGVVGKVNYDVRFFREWDDTNNLLEDNAPLTDEEIEALEKAGDDPLAAFVDGAFPDTVNGAYIKSDTLIGGEIDTFFVYKGRGNGDYIVRFSGVGTGKGDYVRESSSVFRYVGPGNGTHLPIRLVPLAGDKRMVDFGLGVNLARNWILRGEAAITDFDQNVFSNIDNENNRDNAFNITTTLQDSAFNLFGSNIGSVRFNAYWTNQGAGFNPLDRPLHPEFNYKWSLGDTTMTNEESSFETSLSYQPSRFFRLDGNIGNLEKASLGISSNRQLGQIQLLQEKVLPSLTARYENINSETASDATGWNRQNLIFLKTIKRFTPRYSFRREDRAVDNKNRNDITGFMFNDHQAGLGIQKFLGIDWDLKYQYRLDYLYDPNNRRTLLEHAKTQTLGLRGTLLPDPRLRGQFGVQFREKNFDDFFIGLSADSMFIYQPDPQFQDTTWQDRQSHLANLELQYRNKEGTINVRWDYKVATELEALREIRYINVGENRGNFRFDSTLAEYVPDPNGDFIQIFFQTGNFENVIRLETGWQLQYKPKLSRNISNFGDLLMNRISSTTYLKIEENNRGGDIWDIYLFNLSKFHNFETTARGAYIINQDLFYNERNPDWGMLFRIRYRDVIANQFLDADNNEARINNDRILQFRRRLFRRKLNLTAEYRNTLNKRWVTSSPSRNLNILSQAFVGRFNYRPNIKWQIQLDAERGVDRDRKETDPLQVNVWEVKPQLSYSIRSKARATANMTYINVTEVENPADRPIPFEMGNGKKVGDSWLWTARVEYFISNNITINANYTGRKDAGAFRTIHIGKAEVRAFF